MRGKRPSVSLISVLTVLALIAACGGDGRDATTITTAAAGDTTTTAAAGDTTTTEAAGDTTTTAAAAGEVPIVVRSRRDRPGYDGRLRRQQLAARDDRLRSMMRQRSARA